MRHVRRCWPQSGGGKSGSTMTCVSAYYRHIEHPGHLYKTTDASERRRLGRRGWVKCRHDHLNRAYGLHAMTLLMEQPDGEYRWRGLSGTFRRVGAGEA